MPDPDPGAGDPSVPVDEPGRPDEGGDAEVRRLRDELAAERAGTEHWRDVARRREEALLQLKQRTSVRALLSLERRTAGLRARARRAGGAVRGRIDTWTVVASAVPAAIDGPARRRRLEDLVADIDRSGSTLQRDPGRSILFLALDSADPPPWLAGLAAESDRVVAAPRDDTAAASIDGAGEDLVVLVAATTEPLTAAWVAGLTGAVTGDVVAATGVLVHPDRPPTRATPHDLLVRSAGFTVALDPAGVPHLEARSAGRQPARPDPGVAGPDPVAGTSGALVAVDRTALAAAGGYRATGVADVSVLDLCLRLRRRGGRVVCVPDVVAYDHRAVSRPLDLTRPIDESGPEWRALLERHGPFLRRSAPGVDPAALDVVLTVGSPSRKVADRWGDWHLAEALGRALVAHGHRAHVQTLDEVNTPRSRCADVHLVLRGLARVARTPGQVHALWIISHPEDLDAEELDAADLVLVASTRFAAALRERTTTPVAVLLQATDADRFRPRPVAAVHAHDVTVVGKSRDVLRPMVRDAVAAGLRPAIHGTGWEGLVDPALVVTDHVDNHDLPVIYSSAGVVLNDHWDTMRRWGFVSNRVFDVLACGAPLVSDHLPEIDDLFGDLVPTWDTPEELGSIVAAALADPVAARDRAARARAIVLADHTFDRRATQLVEALAPLVARKR